MFKNHGSRYGSRDLTDKFTDDPSRHSTSIWSVFFVVSRVKQTLLLLVRFQRILTYRVCFFCRTRHLYVPSSIGIVGKTGKIKKISGLTLLVVLMWSIRLRTLETRRGKKTPLGIDDPTLSESRCVSYHQLKLWSPTPDLDPRR